MSELTPHYGPRAMDGDEAKARRRAFFEHLVRETPAGSNRAQSYTRALDLLSKILEQEPIGFEDCQKLWQATDVRRLHALLKRVREEQKKKEASVWNLEGIAPSYLRDGFCSAALGAYRLFLVETAHTEALLDIYHAHTGSEEELGAKLRQREPDVPDFLIDELVGIDVMREARARLNQSAFRSIILRVYESRCCITGLDIPEVNRASHIVPWASHAKARMDPRNGLCLSATYDAAFDRHLITLDESYRLVLSRDLRDHYTSASVREWFVRREGDAIELPRHYRPAQNYLEQHRAACAV